VTLPDSELPFYRPGVGIMLLNREGLVFVGRRIDRPAGVAAWQMPQGGIDPGETPREAAIRELHEEVGTDRAEILGETEGWLHYDLPPEIVGNPWSNPWRWRYRGQRQKWFAMRFTGKDAEINVASPGGGHKAEFVNWRWEPMKNLPNLIVPFKRPVYERVVKEFSKLAGK